MHLLPLHVANYPHHTSPPVILNRFLDYVKGRIADAVLGPSPHALANRRIRSDKPESELGNKGCLPDGYYI